MASHKTLNSVVRSAVDSFTSLMNYRGDDYVMGHIVQAAWATGARELRFDLLTGQASPSPLLVPPVASSLRDKAHYFRDLVRSSNSDMSFVSAAELVVTVDPSTRRPYDDSGLYESPFTCTVSITDDRGRIYSYTRSDWWFPEHRPGVSRLRWPGYWIRQAVKRMRGRR